MAMSRERWAMVATIALLLAMFLAEQAGLFSKWWLSRWLDFGSQLGSQPAITMAGVVLATIILEESTHRRRFKLAIIFTILLAAGAWLTYPLYGINKNSATPSWCLISSAITCVLWMIFALLIDVPARTHGWGILIRGGQNALLAYLLMPLCIHAIGLLGVKLYSQLGQSFATGVTRSIAASIIMLALAGLLERQGVRVRL
jgi:predicted acyltransferase